MKLEEIMVTTIYLVRHADSIYSTDELNRPISETGMLDVKDLHNQFADVEIDKVFSSPYKRSMQTVELIARSRKLSIEIIEDFRERTKIEGKLDNFLENVAKLWSNETLKLSGGESNVEGQSRGVQALEKIVSDNEGKSVVIGTHGDLMSLIINYYNKSYGYEFWRSLDMPDAYRLTFENNELENIERVWQRTRR
jgi:2,3-bisphosphoglycerate-dependent phosphoglycerate mutase